MVGELYIYELIASVTQPDDCDDWNGWVGGLQWKRGSRGPPTLGIRSERI